MCTCVASVVSVATGYSTLGHRKYMVCDMENISIVGSDPDSIYFGIQYYDKTCIQISVQTGEDNEYGEAQTEPTVTEEKWVQWPPEDLRGWGKGGAPGDNEGEDEAAVLSGHVGTEGEGGLRLIAFLKKASQVSEAVICAF